MISSLHRHSYLSSGNSVTEVMNLYFLISVSESIQTVMLTLRSMKKILICISTLFPTLAILQVQLKALFGAWYTALKLFVPIKQTMSPSFENAIPVFLPEVTLNTISCPCLMQQSTLSSTAKPLRKRTLHNDNVTFISTNRSTLMIHQNASSKKPSTQPSSIPPAALTLARLLARKAVQSLSQTYQSAIMAKVTSKAL